MSIYINSQIIHIIVDVIIIIAVSFYFHKKNQQLQKKIKELEEKLEPIQNVIKEHDTVLQSILYNMKKPLDIVNTTQSYNTQVVKESPEESKEESKEESPEESKEESPEESDVDLVEETKIVHVESSEDLDKELQNELSELEESTNIVEKEVNTC
jgi:NACalpha-BTF3-like transcription factor